MALDPAQNGYKIERLQNFYNQLSERLAALPGVKTTTFTRNAPMSGSWSRFGIEVPGYQSRPGEEMAVLFNQIAPQFFATFGAPKTAYIPYSQYEQLGQRILCVRAMDEASALVAAVRQEARNLDPNLPVFNVKTFAEHINESVSRERLVAMLSSFFGLFALLLASLGLYGVMAYVVTRRTREIGIRMALGARAANVLWMVLRETLLLVLIGIVIGLPLTLSSTRLTEGLLFGLTPTDPLTIALAMLVMVAIAALAGYLPARRAARLEPVIALRNE